MQKAYKPRDNFLKDLIEYPRDIDPKKNRSDLDHLIRLTCDIDVSNRDWAVFLLSQERIDAPEVRNALIVAASDDDDNVRAEAIRGLAEIDKKLALPFLQKALAAKVASAPIFEAAAIVADISLVKDLRAFATPSGDDYLDGLAVDALRACRG